MAYLYASGVKKVFDLRSDIETIKFGHPPPNLGPQVEIERIPVFKDEDYSPELLTLRSENYKSGKEEVLHLQVLVIRFGSEHHSSLSWKLMIIF